MSKTARGQGSSRSNAKAPNNVTKKPKVGTKKRPAAAIRSTPAAAPVAGIVAEVCGDQLPGLDQVCHLAPGHTGRHAVAIQADQVRLSWSDEDRGTYESAPL